MQEKTAGMRRSAIGGAVRVRGVSAGPRHQPGVAAAQAGGERPAPATVAPGARNLVRPGLIVHGPDGYR